MFIYLLFVSIYRSHVLTPLSGWQVCEYHKYQNHRCQHCIIRSQFVATVKHIAKRCLPTSVEAQELNLKYALVTEELNPGPFTPAAKFLTTRRPRPLTDLRVQICKLVPVLIVWPILDNSSVINIVWILILDISVANIVIY